MPIQQKVRMVVILRMSNNGQKLVIRGEKCASHAPCWKLRVPVHLRDKLRTPSESASEISDCEESHANDSITHTRASTPVAARTRSKLKT